MSQKNACEMINWDHPMPSLLAPLDSKFATTPNRYEKYLRNFSLHVHDDDYRYLTDHPEIEILINFIVKETEMHRPLDNLSFCANLFKKNEHNLEDILKLEKNHTKIETDSVDSESLPSSISTPSMNSRDIDSNGSFSLSSFIDRLIDKAIVDVDACSYDTKGLLNELLENIDYDHISMHPPRISILKKSK